jgi:hypothetical protein
VFVSLLVAAGCKTHNPNSCELIENHCEGVDAPDASPGDGAGGSDSSDGSDGSMACRGNDDCASMTGATVCDVAATPHACVFCTEASHPMCTGTTPRCEAQQACAECTGDGDCGGTGVCLQDGSCAMTDNIIHVTTLGANEDSCGSVATPCALAAALRIARSPRNVIKLDDDGPYVGFTVSNTELVVDARGASTAGAVINRSIDVFVLAVRMKADLTILGGILQGKSGEMTDGIKCDDATLTIVGSTIKENDLSAINATKCTLNIKKALITDNGKSAALVAGIVTNNGSSLTISQSRLFANHGGGINVNVNGGTFTIVGNAIYNNGSGGINGSAAGGISISTAESPANRLEFNTIANNQSSGGRSPGIDCVAGAFIARNNISRGNVISSILPGTLGDQVGGNCKHAFSDIEQTLSSTTDGGNNLNVDPLFNADFSIMAGSPVRGKADMNAVLDGLAKRDINGTLRVSPADIGAYQAPPQ